VFADEKSSVDVMGVAKLSRFPDAETFGAGLPLTLKFARMFGDKKTKQPGRALGFLWRRGRDMFVSSMRLTPPALRASGASLRLSKFAPGEFVEPRGFVHTALSRKANGP
jgi:hypothetical protein